MATRTLPELQPVGVSMAPRIRGRTLRSIFASAPVGDWAASNAVAPFVLVFLAYVAAGTPRAGNHQHSEQQPRTGVARVRDRACGRVEVRLSHLAGPCGERVSGCRPGVGFRGCGGRSGHRRDTRGAHRHIPSPPHRKLRSLAVTPARRAGTDRSRCVRKRTRQFGHWRLLSLRNRDPAVLGPAVGLADLLAWRQHGRAARDTTPVYAIGVASAVSGPQPSSS